MASGYRTFTRFTLLILNCVLLLLAVALLAISAVLYQAGNVMTDNFVIPLLEILEVSYQMTLATVITKISVACIVVGALLLLITAVGFFGAIFRLIPLLILYGVLVLLACGFHIFVIYLGFRTRNQVISSTTKAKLKANLMLYDGNDNRAMTKAWNYLFIMLDCCGVDKQSEVDEFKTSAWSATRGNNKIPGYCCKEATSSTVSTFIGNSCTVSPNEDNSWITKGCYAALSDSVRNYSDGFLAIAFLTLFIGIIAAIYAFVYAYMILPRSRKKLDKRPICEDVPTCNPCDVPICHTECVACKPSVVPMCHTECAACKSCDVPCHKHTDCSYPKYPCVHTAQCHKPTTTRCMKTMTCRKHRPRVCSWKPRCKWHTTCPAACPRPTRSLPRPCDHFIDPPYWIPYPPYGPYDWEFGKKKKGKGYYTDPYDYYMDYDRDVPMLPWKPK